MAFHAPNKLAADLKLQTFSTKHRVKLSVNRNGHIPPREVPETGGAAVGQRFVRGLGPDGERLVERP